jgi:hypothetical protein
LPCGTYQIAIKMPGEECARTYVCAESRMGAVEELIEQTPTLTLDDVLAWALTAEIFEVEPCA